MLKIISQKHSRKLQILLVFLMAASVRLTALGVFRVVDEEDRWAWAVDLFRALLARDLPGTLIGDGYPGVFPAWLETLWLFAGALIRSVRQGGWIGDGGVYLLIHNWGQWSNLAIQRFPIALANTLLVVIIFWYTRRLFGARVAWLAAILISFDPFYLSDSRVNRAEALLTGLMVLSLLALVAHYRRPDDRRQLFISALFGGLAWLTKLQAIVLLPMFGAIHLLWVWRTAAGWRTAAQRWLMIMLVWSGIAALTFVLLWPAVWTVPADTFGLMLKFATRKVGAEGVNLFFLGRTLVDEDPGWLFYPVIFLLRVTPLTLLGLLAGLGLVLGKIVRIPHRPSLVAHHLLDASGVWALILYVALYVAGMSLGSHKQGRFLMSIFPVLDILAALALVHFAERWRWSARQMLAAGGVALAVQLATALPFHPYYFTYFNPLLGGGKMAVNVTRVGWGEGMDRVADYLNSLDNPQSLTVAGRFYKYLLNFKGTALNLEGERGEWLTADKIIFYVQQVQRMQDPNPGVIRYFQQHVPPEKTITINGIDYAWVYPNPITYPAELQADAIPGQLNLFGYRWQTVADGGTAIVVWQNWGQPAPQLAARLWRADTVQTDWVGCVPMTGFKRAAQTSGGVVESACAFSTTGLSPGLYSLQVRAKPAAGNWQMFDFAAGWSAIKVAAAGTAQRIDPATAFAELAAAALPPTAQRLEHTYDNTVRLLAYRLSAETVRPGDTLTLTLYWQAVRRIDRDAQVSVQLFAGDRQLVNLNGVPQNGQRPPVTWRPGEVITDAWRIALPADTPAPALVRIDVGLFQPDTVIPWPVRNLAGQDIPAEIGRVRVRPKTWPEDGNMRPLAFTFGGAVRLEGYSWEAAPDAASATVTLRWRALAGLNADYRIFVHLMAPDGALVAQSDVAPLAGLYPTSVWQPGDIILSEHPLALPTGLSAGRYRLLAGIYTPADGARLPVVDAGGQLMPDSASPLGVINLP